jgi:hypothetical protein
MKLVMALRFYYVSNRMQRKHPYYTHAAQEVLAHFNRQTKASIRHTFLYSEKLRLPTPLFSLYTGIIALK